MGPSPLFWILALAVVGATLAMLVLPLLRRTVPVSDPADESATTAVFRDHKRQLDADLAAGAITPAEHATSLAEITQRFGAELDDSVTTPASVAAPGRGGFVAALVLVACVPVTAGILYFTLGNPAALAPQAAREAPVTNAQVETMVDDLAARLKANPEDGEGWAMLGRSYRVLGRYEASAMAYGEAAKRLPQHAGLLVDWAEATAQAQGRSLLGQPTELLDRALKLEPDNGRALALAGAAAMERGDRPQAIALWTRLRDLLPPGSPQAAQIDAALARANGEAAPAAPGAPAASGAAAASAGTAIPKAGGAAAPKAAASPNVPAPSTAAGSATPAKAGTGAVSGRVELDPKLAGNVAPGDTVFILARDPDGSRMPLAVIRIEARELPRNFELTDAMAMTPAATLSKAARVVVEARVSKSGNAKAASGDLSGTSGPVAPGARDVAVRIDRILP